MWFHFHLWLSLSMSLIFWAKTYMTFVKRRLDWREKWIDLAFDLTFAIIFSIAFIDLFFDIPKIMYLNDLLRRAIING